MQQNSAAISANGNVVAIAYQMLEREQYRKILNSELRSKATPEYLAQQLSNFPATVIHLIKTETGQKIGEVALKRGDSEPEIEISANGELLLVRTNSRSETQNGQTSQLVRVFDTRTSKVVHWWSGQGKFAFRPKNHNGSPILAIADWISKPASNEKGVPPGVMGRLGLWRFDFSEVEDKK